MAGRLPQPGGGHEHPRRSARHRRGGQGLLSPQRHYPSQVPLSSSITEPDLSCPNRSRFWMYLHLLHLGRIPYGEGLAFQKRVVEARKQGLIGDTLLLLEHPPVLTLGRNSSRSNVLVSDEFLASRGVELHE